MDVIVTSGVSPGRNPNRNALKIWRSLNRPIPVALSGVMFRGRVRKHGLAFGATGVHAPM